MKNKRYFIKTVALGAWLVSLTGISSAGVGAPAPAPVAPTTSAVPVAPVLPIATDIDSQALKLQIQSYRSLIKTYLDQVKALRLTVHEKLQGNVDELTKWLGDSNKNLEEFEKGLKEALQSRNKWLIQMAEYFDKFKKRFEKFALDSQQQTQLLLSQDKKSQPASEVSKDKQQPKAAEVSKDK